MAQATKIIFLDFDGPLSNARTVLALGDEGFFDPVAVQALNHICAASGARVVCTSTRTHPDWEEGFIKAVRFFDVAGLDLKYLHPDWSCCTDLDMPRKDHIRQWLKHHPEVTHYAIVDDEKVGLRCTVRVSQIDGMNHNDFEKIAACLDIDLCAAFNEARKQTGRSPQYSLPFDKHDEMLNAVIACRECLTP